MKFELLQHYESEKNVEKKKKRRKTVNQFVKDKSLLFILQDRNGLKEDKFVTGF